MLADRRRDEGRSWPTVLPALPCCSAGIPNYQDTKSEEWEVMDDRGHWRKIKNHRISQVGRDPQG